MDYLCLLLLLLVCNTREFIFFLRYSPFREVASNGSYSSYWWGRIVACVSSVSIICHYYLSMVINGWKQTKKKSRRKVTISISTNPRWIIYYDTPIRRYADTPIRYRPSKHYHYKHVSLDKICLATTRGRSKPPTPFSLHYCIISTKECINSRG